MKIKGIKLEPSDKGSPAVWMQFTDETGQNRKHIFLVGKDDQGTMHRPELTKGDFGWKTIEETITAAGRLDSHGVVLWANPVQRRRLL